MIFPEKGSPPSKNFMSSKIAKFKETLLFWSDHLIYGKTKMRPSMMNLVINREILLGSLSLKVEASDFLVLGLV